MIGMTNEPWFKPKDYGYGNVPINWKGWAITVGFALFITGLVVTVKMGLLSVTLCLVMALIATAIFIPFIKAKTSGEWRWRWGRD